MKTFELDSQTNSKLINLQKDLEKNAPSLIEMSSNIKKAVNNCDTCSGSCRGSCQHIALGCPSYA
jgi:hypothetical protein